MNLFKGHMIKKRCFTALQNVFLQVYGKHLKRFRKTLCLSFKQMHSVPCLQKQLIISYTVHDINYYIWTQPPSSNPSSQLTSDTYPLTDKWNRVLY